MIYLIGMPASGKTTVSKLLSARSGMRLIDTDGEIVKEFGAINDIFDNLGEAAFRNIETEVLRRISAERDAVVSTGGGAVLRAENQKIMRASGKIVYLKTEIETLVARAEGNTERPLLRGGAKERLENLFSERAALYESAADIVVKTDGLSPEEISDIILKELGLI